ncbi:2-hydroxyacid dehydrogenase [Salmonella enterica subsp. enterica serovar Muenchen]|uniref:2-hydroxyacid dehydrogenase n=1 Tax=Salmonella enterica TaxID=28901 RepID=UPI001F0E2C71|nr:2-hydroxyacid dehydrogenase [Salmonella enterica]EEJ6214846.1 2-hydroxyacid dehydrogenase [Salmonella enterica]MCH5442711.1 2-hydroxyacid dehydrogenase [Salmonella enterica subsp. enterica serovar Muenchen]
MKILFTAENDGNIEELNRIGELIIKGWATGAPILTEDELIKYGKDCEILITSYDDITERVIKSCTKLKLIACTRSNPVNIDVTSATACGVPVIYTPGRNSDATAELTISHMLNVARNIPQAYMALKEHKFTQQEYKNKSVKKGLKEDCIWDMSKNSPYEIFKGIELKNKQLGIIGYGSIGQRVGKIARGFGMKISVYDPFVSEMDINEPCIQKMELDDLLKTSDFVTLHLKINKLTKGLLNYEKIQLMKPSAYLINTSRAAVLDENAVIDALRNKRIAGAGFDVFQNEPIYENHPYINEFNNVIITPHIAGATKEALTNHTKMIISEIKRFINGQPLLYQFK